jgi:hypothetical protein
MVVFAIDQVQGFERRLRRMTGDAELARARARFDTVCRDAGSLRDLIAHLDEYAVGAGWRQTGRGGSPPISEQNLAAVIWWGDGGGTIINLGDHQLNLRRAADATVELAEVVERVRVRHLDRVEQEANAAARRRFGMPPE